MGCGWAGGGVGRREGGSLLCTPCMKRQAQQQHRRAPGMKREQKGNGGEGPAARTLHESRARVDEPAAAPKSESAHSRASAGQSRAESQQHAIRHPSQAHPARAVHQHSRHPSQQRRISQAQHSRVQMNHACACGGVRQQSTPGTTPPPTASTSGSSPLLLPFPYSAARCSAVRHGAESLNVN